jgi:hypothetical protein
MKIAKIIDIMKLFTSSLLSVKTTGIPVLRVIIPYLWGTSPHVLGKNVGPRARAARVGGAFRHADSGGRKAPTAPHTNDNFLTDTTRDEKWLVLVGRRPWPPLAAGTEARPTELSSYKAAVKKL